MPGPRGDRSQRLVTSTISPGGQSSCRVPRAPVRWGALRSVVTGRMPMKVPTSGRPGSVHRPARTLLRGPVERQRGASAVVRAPVALHRAPPGDRRCPGPAVETIPERDGPAPIPDRRSFGERWCEMAVSICSGRAFRCVVLPQRECSRSIRLLCSHTRHKIVISQHRYGVIARRGSGPWLRGGEQGVSERVMRKLRGGITKGVLPMLASAGRHPQQDPLPRSASGWATRVREERALELRSGDDRKGSQRMPDDPHRSFSSLPTFQDLVGPTSQTRRPDPSLHSPMAVSRPAIQTFHATRLSQPTGSVGESLRAASAGAPAHIHGPPP